jgi:salicylate hydroxylase
MGIEDAMTLSLLFTLPSTRSQTLMLLTAYEELRQQRCADMQLSERQKRNASCMPLGPEQRARDEGFRTSQMGLAVWDEMDGPLGGVFAEFINLINFDAREAVEDWWTKWGPAMRVPSAVPDGSGDAPTSGLLILDTDVVREGSSCQDLSDMLADQCTVSGR